jgi:hypothetical protein
MRKSPSALGTVIPNAIVCGSGHGSLADAPLSKWNVLCAVEAAHAQ